MKPQLKIFVSLLLCLCVQSLHAQQRLMLNGGFMTISSNTFVVIDNPSSNAVTRTNGHIISEGESNILKWNLGTTTGTYTVPFGYSNTDYIPVTFTKSAGTGSGSFLFSTYHTGWNNSSSLPTGVQNVAHNGVDVSAFVLDRFWGIDVQNYTSKPSLTNFSLTYLNNEVTQGSNVLQENGLIMQRWNPNINDWADFIPGVTIDTVNNKITLPSLSGNNLFRWWVISSSYETLPVELSSFNGNCDNGIRTFNWTTASEINSNQFILERSNDGINWTTISTVNGAGNSNRPVNYSATDERAAAEADYYRLKQTDRSGGFYYSSVIRVSCDDKSATASIEIYPNPSNGNFYLKNLPVGAELTIMNIKGESLYTENISSSQEEIALDDPKEGIYLLSVNDGKSIQTQKILISK